MLLTEEFLIAAGTCEKGLPLAQVNNYIGVDYDEVIKDLLRKGLRDDAGWMITAKKSEAYVRMNGSVIMIAYQVFSPLTGQHTKYETEEEAKQALIEVAKEVLKHHCPAIVQEISNENGDSVWIPTNLHETLIIN